MASRRYNTYKFRYTTDLNQVVVKRQREYHENVTDRVLTPITNTFLTTVITDGVKTDSFQVDMRHTISYIAVTDQGSNTTIGEFSSYLPYPPTDQRLVTHISEILNDPIVICADYVGETNTYGNRV